MNKNKSWFITNIVVTALSAICGVAGIFTGIKAAPYTQELTEKEIAKNVKVEEVSK